MESLGRWDNEGPGSRGHSMAALLLYRQHRTREMREGGLRARFFFSSKSSIPTHGAKVNKQKGEKGEEREDGREGMRAHMFVRPR